MAFLTNSVFDSNAQLSLRTSNIILPGAMAQLQDHGDQEVSRDLL